MSRLRIIRWTDAAFSLTNEATRPIFTEIAGWIIEEHEDYILVASERNDQGDYRQFTAIPRGILATEKTK